MRNKEKVMKKFLIGCATAAMMLSPAIAEAGGRHGGGNNFQGIIGVCLQGHSPSALIIHTILIFEGVSKDKNSNHFGATSLSAQLSSTHGCIRTHGLF